MGNGASLHEGVNKANTEFSSLRDEYVDLIAKTAKKDPEFRKKLQVEISHKAGLPETNANVALDLTSHGDENTTSFRIQALEKGEPVSLWHDVPLFCIDKASGERTEELHFVCEIPKWTRKKFEIATDEVKSPIKQDEKKGVLREFRTGAAGLFFNYGCFPQTWEDPSHTHPDANAAGDNDPLDVCEIGTRQILTGQVRPVKVLGVLCMIDEGEADWKVIVIDVADPWAPFLNDIQDVDKHIPGMLDSIREWFRDYKVADGKPQNVFGLGEKFMDKDYTMKIIHECHDSWKKLVAGENTAHEKAAKLCLQRKIQTEGPEKQATGQTSEE